ncbi:hypothetical protein [Sphingomonas baiyangensis]|uniref:Uncharacterized protein n=1 Tax=Sphingomonas baiyangensis TaxID=2572576 RepID=A0A4U1L3B0_9SPHN|nr:hypothetical protein [Sphingomonas baiyangensis]TKD50576.1 hypothetical protein FBR43_07205 [Sphingomonas baiyangensis]
MPIIYGSGGDPLSWADARTKVRTDLWRPGTAGVPDDVADRALHAALRKLESERRWLWLQNVPATITADAETQTIERPADCGAVNALSYLSGPRGYDLLTPISIAAARASARGTYVGSPQAYALGDDRIHLDCKVAAGTQFEILYRSRTPLDVAQAIEAPPLHLTTRTAPVIAWACSLVALSYLKNEAEAARQRAAYDAHVETLMNEDDDAAGDAHGGFVVPDIRLHIAAHGAGDY